ncbi:MAG: NERD domain-containing protein [bacterium]
MAKIIPKNISSYNLTASELKVYNLLKEKLDNTFSVYFSVAFHIQGRLRKNSSLIKGEIDFVIHHPDYGILALEVKGGKKLIIENGEWKILLEDYKETQKYRILKMSPIEQAKRGAYALYNYYNKKYTPQYSGIVSYGVCFPNYSIKGDLDITYSRDLIIDINELNDISSKIIKMYKSFETKNREKLSEKEFNNMSELISANRTYGIAVSKVIEINKNRLENINRVQDYIIDFLKYYKKAKFKGSAGTGKTWIAMKKANKCVDEGLKTLIVCFNRNLAIFIKKQLDSSIPNKKQQRLSVYNFHNLAKDILGIENYKELIKEDKELTHICDVGLNYIVDDKKYEAIIIDEGQDFKEEWQIFLQALLKSEEKGIMYVFYDPNQNMFNVEYKDFFIENPEYILKENLRNTKEIFDFASKYIQGFETTSSQIEGLKPEIIKIGSELEGTKYLIKLLNELINENAINLNQIILLSDRKFENSFIFKYRKKLKFSITDKKENQTDLLFKTIQSFKGLESDIVIYLEHDNSENEKSYMRYVAYTRAKFVLKILKYEPIY